MKNLLTLVILCLFKLVVLAQPSTETVGNPTDSTSVSKYTGWINQGVLTFSGNAQVQNTQPSNYQGASGGGNVFFTNTPGTYFEISGFDSTFQRPDGIAIYFGMYNSDATNLNELLVEYSTDGINYKRISYSSFRIIPASWAAMQASIEEKINLKDFRLRFTQTSATKQFRIDDIRFRYGYLLSITLQQFTFSLNENSVQLLWASTTGSNREMFKIEKSLDGINYISMGEQYAKGTGSFNYSVIDRSPLTAVSYYRLKMMNVDGGYSYSNILRIQPKLTSKNILQNIYPLPAKDRLYIQVQSDKTEKAEISVTDISGKIVITSSVSLAAGVNNSSINVQSLSKGVYFFKVATSETSETRKIIIGK